ncbi:MAG: uridylate kinase [Clostridiales bacterium]|jgi:glutamate 5-kinase|nr:uridylate kinase [Clostridiales bacterium]
MKKIELVIKIGSMALINKDYNDINYNIFARLSRELRPGYALVSSGATEIGRLDYIKRNGRELKESETDSEIKTDYSAQGQSVLMQNYRQFVDSKFSLRQILVEHQHFNDKAKREHLKDMLLRCPAQNAVPIINYNDAVSDEENRKMEIQAMRREGQKTVECVDNDETAAQIACLLGCETLLILTGTDGIYRVASDPSTLVENVFAENAEKLVAEVCELQKSCVGASRKGAFGALAKLEYIKEPLRRGIKVIISNSAFKVDDILSGKARRTAFYLK